MWDYPPDIPAITVGGIFVDLDRGIVKVHDQRVELTHLQLTILAALAHAHGRILGDGWIIDAVWNGQDRTNRSIKQHVYNIRKKLGSESWRLKTVRGVGYCLDVE